MLRHTCLMDKQFKKIKEQCRQRQDRLRSHDWQAIQWIGWSDYLQKAPVPRRFIKDVVETESFTTEESRLKRNPSTVCKRKHCSWNRSGTSSSMSPWTKRHLMQCSKRCQRAVSKSWVTMDQKHLSTQWLLLSLGRCLHKINQNVEYMKATHEWLLDEAARLRDLVNNEDRRLLR